METIPKRTFVIRSVFINLPPLYGYLFWNSYFKLFPLHIKRSVFYFEWQCIKGTRGGASQYFSIDGINAPMARTHKGLALGDPVIMAAKMWTYVQSSILGMAFRKKSSTSVFSFLRTADGYRSDALLHTLACSLGNQLICRYLTNT
jgi:hypothetical protein